MPTIRDVAKLAGVAPITVSRVVNNTGYISEDTRARVERAIAELEYVPNSLSVSLRFKKTNTIALLVSDITNPFWTTVARGAEDAGSEQGLNVILCNTDEKRIKQDNYINSLLQRQTDGFLLSPADDDVQVVQRLRKRHVPVVVLDRKLDGMEVDTVRSDSETGAHRLTQYLLGLGHRRIGMLSVSASIATGRQRVEGYVRALQEAGIAIDPSLIGHGQFKQESGYQMTLELMRLAHPPTAIFGGNNFMMLGALKALSDLGLRVPEDVSVVGFDDLPYVGQEPFATVIAQAPYQIGLLAAQLLIDLITGAQKPAARDIVLPVEFIERRSACPPPIR